jgi:hypothetical protein
MIVFVTYCIGIQFAEIFLQNIDFQSVYRVDNWKKWRPQLKFKVIHATRSHMDRQFNHYMPTFRLNNDSKY